MGFFIEFRTKPALLSLLLEHGAEVNTKSNTGITPLHIACSANLSDVGIVNALLEKGAIVTETDENGWVRTADITDTNL